MRVATGQKRTGKKPILSANIPITEDTPFRCPQHAPPNSVTPTLRAFKELNHFGNYQPSAIRAGSFNINGNYEEDSLHQLIAAFMTEFHIDVMSLSDARIPVSAANMTQHKLSRIYDFTKYMIIIHPAHSAKVKPGTRTSSEHKSKSFAEQSPTTAFSVAKPIAAVTQ
jgi:hypothetical protein